MLTRNRADAELGQAEERADGGGCGRKTATPSSGPRGPHSEGSRSWWGFSLFWEFVSSQEAGRSSPSLLRSGSWDDGNGKRGAS